jgi:hypothetical protein
VCVILVLPILIDIREGQYVKLLLTTTTCRVHWKENGESQASSNKTYNGQHLEKSKIQISIERLVVENIFIWNTFEATKPVKLSFR